MKNTDPPLHPALFSSSNKTHLRHLLPVPVGQAARAPEHGALRALGLHLHRLLAALRGEGVERERKGTEDERGQGPVEESARTSLIFVARAGAHPPCAAGAVSRCDSGAVQALRMETRRLSLTSPSKSNALRDARLPSPVPAAAPLHPSHPPFLSPNLSYLVARRPLLRVVDAAALDPHAWIVVPLLLGFFIANSAGGGRGVRIAGGGGWVHRHQRDWLLDDGGC